MASSRNSLIPADISRSGSGITQSFKTVKLSVYRMPLAGSKIEPGWQGHARGSEEPFLREKKIIRSRISAGMKLPPMPLFAASGFPQYLNGRRPHAAGWATTTGELWHRGVRFRVTRSHYERPLKVAG